MPGKQSAGRTKNTEALELVKQTCVDRLLRVVRAPSRRAGNMDDLSLLRTRLVGAHLALQFLSLDLPN